MPGRRFLLNEHGVTVLQIEQATVDVILGEEDEFLVEVVGKK